MTKEHRGNIYVWLLFVSAIFIYVIFVPFSFHKPMLADEVETAVGAANSLSSLRNPHTVWDDAFSYGSGVKYRLLTVYLYALAFKIFGISAESGRLVGILSFLVTLILIYKIAIWVFKDERNKSTIGLIACSLYAVNPLVIRVSLMVVEANTVMLISSLFVYAFLKTYRMSNIRSSVLLGVLLSLVLLTKFTIFPFLILPMLIPFVIDRGFKKGIYEISTISIVGISLYLVLWGLYSKAMNIPFLLPFGRYIHVGSALPSSTISEQIRELCLTTIRAVVWESPFYLLLGVIATGTRIREFLNNRKIALMDFLIVYTWLIFFGCLFLGVSWGMPMYQFPMMPMLSIIVAAFIVQNIAGFGRKSVILYGVLTSLFVVYNITIVGDLLYSLNYDLKESLINSTVGTMLMKMTLKLLLYLIPLLFVFFIAKLSRTNLVSQESIISPMIARVHGISLLKALNLSLLVVAVSANLALNIMQARADYNTSFGYGGRGTGELFNFLEENLSSDSVVLASYDIIYNYNIRRGVSPYFPNEVFEDRQLFIKTVEEKKPECIVIGITTNTAYQISEVLQSQEIQSFLQRNFERRQIGSYTVWLRRSTG